MFLHNIESKLRPVPADRWPRGCVELRSKKALPNPPLSNANQTPISCAGVNNDHGGTYVRTGAIVYWMKPLIIQVDIFHNANKGPDGFTLESASLHFEGPQNMVFSLSDTLAARLSVDAERVRIGMFKGEFEGGNKVSHYSVLNLREMDYLDRVFESARGLTQEFFLMCNRY